MAIHRPIKMVSVLIVTVSFSRTLELHLLLNVYPHIKNYSLSYAFAQDCTHFSLPATSAMYGPQPNTEVGFRTQDILVLHFSHFSASPGNCWIHGRVVSALVIFMYRGNRRISSAVYWVESCLPPKCV